MRVSPSDIRNTLHNRSSNDSQPLSNYCNTRVLSLPTTDWSGELVGVLRIAKDGTSGDGPVGSILLFGTHGTTSSCCIYP